MMPAAQVQPRLFVNLSRLRVQTEEIKGGLKAEIISICCGFAMNFGAIFKDVIKVSISQSTDFKPPHAVSAVPCESASNCAR